MLCHKCLQANSVRAMIVQLCLGDKVCWVRITTWLLHTAVAANFLPRNPQTLYENRFCHTRSRVFVFKTRKESAPSTLASALCRWCLKMRLRRHLRSGLALCCLCRLSPFWPALHFVAPPLFLAAMPIGCQNISQVQGQFFFLWVHWNSNLQNIVHAQRWGKLILKALANRASRSNTAEALDS